MKHHNLVPALKKKYTTLILGCQDDKIPDVIKRRGLIHLNPKKKE
jgi:hypothetical protein